jgi:hypothetical protein
MLLDRLTASNAISLAFLMLQVAGMLCKGTPAAFTSRPIYTYTLPPCCCGGCWTILGADGMNQAACQGLLLLTAVRL